MLESIEFRNFRALRDTTLPLGPLTLIVGPNGSGKTTALRAIAVPASNGFPPLSTVISAHAPRAAKTALTFHWRFGEQKASALFEWQEGGGTRGALQIAGQHPHGAPPELEATVKAA